ncbi:unnamed protein product [Adineta steineri]|uniref:Uncharacterized protein n=1 Tax=Adineta steineri TaxID=433720 RepID=A0A813Z1R6_9BILA|nr:unnamed protein product [Adineta steineri]
MEQQNNVAALNDSAGVLPMDTGAITNGNHDEGDNSPSGGVGIANGKKGRGRPPKSTSSPKVVKKVDAPTSGRGRGRPPKAVETSPAKKVVVPQQQEEEEEVETNGDANKKKRGRPSKIDTPDEQTNGIKKPQVQATPVAIPQEQDSGDELTKRKRGRPSAGATPKKVVVASPPPSKPTEDSSARKRGRPSGSGVKKAAPKPKISPANDDGSAKKQRGRPKKPSTTPAVVATSANETATVTSSNGQ